MFDVLVESAQRIALRGRGALVAGEAGDRDYADMEIRGPQRFRIAATTRDVGTPYVIKDMGTPYVFELRRVSPRKGK